jgi:hypothetical protein
MQIQKTILCNCRASESDETERHQAICKLHYEWDESESPNLFSRRIFDSCGKAKHTTIRHP